MEHSHNLVINYELSDVKVKSNSWGMYMQGRRSKWGQFVPYDP